MAHKTIVLGGGITGISAGYKQPDAAVYEAKNVSGGICASYYIDPTKPDRIHYDRTIDEEDYRFELGGGHWVFGGNAPTLDFIHNLTPMQRYERKASVYLPDKDLLVPYPIQNHLYALGKPLATKIYEELNSPSNIKIKTMQDWLTHHFGPTLNTIFFKPFHDLYTANLTNQISPQDPNKTPLDLKAIKLGLRSKTPNAGYNTTFLYPKNGLNTLMSQLASQATVNYDKLVTKICLRDKKVCFSDNTKVEYAKLYSTLPLHINMELAGLHTDEPQDPYTSVLVFNIGAIKGKRCPKDHWVYIPKSKSGFHRVGFYSNVDKSFLPKSKRAGNRVSLYVEKAYLGGTIYPPEDLDNLKKSIINELIDWGFIESAEIVHPTWIKTAYTWSRVNSQWKIKALDLLKQHEIHSIGRYGRWHFQGIAESMQEGFEISANLE